MASAKVHSLVLYKRGFPSTLTTGRQNMKWVLIYVISLVTYSILYMNKIFIMLAALTRLLNCVYSCMMYGSLWTAFARLAALMVLLACVYSHMIYWNTIDYIELVYPEFGAFYRPHL